MEIWKPFVKGCYEVSSLGRARSVTRHSADGRLWKGKVLSLAFDGYYMYFFMSVNGRRAKSRIHTAVARCFLGKRPAGKEADHIDGDKFNNAASNLEYVTHVDNQRRASKIGRMPTKENGRWKRRWRPALVKSS